MNLPYIPHSALGGDLINGWCGPCEVQAHAHFPVALPDAAYLAVFRGETAWVACFLSPDACGGDTLPRRNVCLTRGQNFSFDPARCRMRLDPRREEEYLTAPLHLPSEHAPVRISVTQRTQLTVQGRLYSFGQRRLLSP